MLEAIIGYCALSAGIMLMGLFLLTIVGGKYGDDDNTPD